MAGGCSPLEPSSRGHRWLQGSEFAAPFDAYCEYLRRRGYTAPVIRDSRDGVAHFLHWIKCRRHGIADIDEATVRRFLDRHVPNCHCAKRCLRTRTRVRQALARWLQVLRAQGSIAPLPRATTELDTELARFERHLIEVCGLSASSRYSMRRHVRSFLLSRFGTGAIDFAALKVVDVRRFIEQRGAHLQPISLRPILSSLHSYFRLRALSGARIEKLLSSLPRIVRWSLANLPQTLAPEQVERLLGALDRTRPGGRRDYAMTRRLADLGLRAVEVSRLSLAEPEHHHDLRQSGSVGARTGRAALAGETHMNRHTTVRQRVHAYLQERRQAGCALRVIGSQLRSFVRFAEARRHHGPLTVELALAWCQASPRAGPRTSAMRLAQLRPFMQFCHRSDPATAVPPAQFFGPAFRRVTPHIYSPAEIRALLSAATRLPPAGGLRAHSYATLFGLLAATGLRLSEALRLERRDVDFQQGLLHIRQSKFYKSRYVPLHPTTVRALRRYTEQRDTLAPNPASPLFFLTKAARPMRPGAVAYTFAKLRSRLHWRSRGGHPAPRIHDLRFTFICRRLELWYAQGLDPQPLMLSLFTYVGHVNVTSTYWYLNATPRLMSLAAQRCQPLAARGAP